LYHQAPTHERGSNSTPPVAPQLLNQQVTRVEVILKRPGRQLTGVQLGPFAGQERIAEQPNGAAIAGADRRSRATIFPVWPLAIEPLERGLRFGDLAEVVELPPDLLAPSAGAVSGKPS